MGVGLLGLPFVFKSAGWFGGSFCLSIFSFITWRTSILIGRELNGDPRPSYCFDDSPFKSPLQPGSMPESRMLPPLRSFPEIARAAFGGTGSFVLAVILYFELFSCLCVFFVTIGDHLHELFPTISVTHHMMTVAAASTIPTMLLRTPKLLSYLSMVGTISTIAVVLAVILSAVLEGDMTKRVAEERGIEDARPYHTGWRTEGLMLSFGLVAYCFSGHAIVPAIYTSMARPQDFEKMVTFTFAIVICCCFAVAISGYYMFGSVVHDQVTLSLEQSSDAALAMKGLTWMMILTGKAPHGIFRLLLFAIALTIQTSL
jgi:vesicular inhibitory amino acid transporter